MCDEDGPNPALYRLRRVSSGLCGSVNSIELQGCFMLIRGCGTKRDLCSKNIILDNNMIIKTKPQFKRNGRS